MVYVPVTNNQNDYHTYSVNWTSASITWMLDGAPVRTLKYGDAQGGKKFPQTPMRLKVGIWAAPSGAPGIIEWAGGQPDLSKGPYAMTVESANIVNYSPGKEYRYKDRTGNWDSIEVIGGSTGGIVVPGQDITPSVSGKPVSITTASTIIPTVSEGKTGGSSASSPTITSVAKPAASSNATALTTSAIVAKPSNATASISQPSVSASAKPATTNGAAAFGATSAAVAGLSLLFLAFLA
jgi:beta-glucanase (GH16 family)